MELERERGTKPRLVLLDANIIIEAHALGIWQGLIKKVDISVPSTIARKEAKFFFSKKENRIVIDLSSDVKQGLITELSASAEEIKRMLSKFTQDFVDSIDAGEAEAIALLLSNRAKDHVFCTGDRMTIQALSMLDMKDRGISMERLLRSIGITGKLKRHYTEEFFKDALEKGSMSMIQGQGLVRDRKKKK